MPQLEVSYAAYAQFELPDGVHLLKPSENRKAHEDERKTGKPVPFSWWIKWATLYYIDADGKQQEIEGDMSDGQYKYHIEGSEKFSDNDQYDTEYDWEG